jgi:CYTH domain-containing protein
MHTSALELRDHYDAVFHLVTAARGAEQFYTLANNAARYETPEEAIRSDDALIAAWTGHPHLRVIDNRWDFEGKMRALLREIAAFLGQPRPLETARKFLIRYPDVSLLEKKPSCERVEILQAYLRSEVPGEMIRIRRRGSHGNYLYYRTRKRLLPDSRRVETEERLSRSEFLDLLQQADPAYRTLRKDRFCLSENGLYYQIDLFPFWQDQAIMEVELYGPEDEVPVPEGIQVLREVTGEEEYTNPYLARFFS